MTAAPLALAHIFRGSRFITLGGRGQRRRDVFLWRRTFLRGYPRAAGREAREVHSQAYHVCSTSLHCRAEGEEEVRAGISSGEVAMFCAFSTWNFS